MKKPLLSVIVPVFNEEAYISRCLDSVINKDDPGFPYEILVSNNCSTDGTSEIINRYRGLPNIIINEHVDHLPANLNWYRALSEAQGRYVIFLGADDVLSPNCLEEFITAATLVDSAAMYVFHSSNYIEASDVIKEFSAFFPSSAIIPGEDIFSLLLRADPFYVGATFFNKDFIFNRDFFLRYNHCFDISIQIEAAKRGVVYFSPKPVVIRTWRDGSHLSRNRKDLLAVMEHFILKLRASTLNYGGVTQPKDSQRFILNSTVRFTLGEARKSLTCGDMRSASQLFGFACALSDEGVKQFNFSDDPELRISNLEASAVGEAIGHAPFPHLSSARLIVTAE